MALAIHVSGLGGVTMTSPLSPEFDDLARPLIGRVADIGLQLKPMLVVVTNESARTVVSFSKTWRVSYPGGRIYESRDHLSFPEAICGDALVGDGPRGMAPGVRRVEAKGLVIQGWGNYPGGEYYDQFLPQFVEEKDRMLRHATELRVELNAVIFDDGTLVGPDDQSWLTDLFTAYVSAKQQWYRTIVSALESGASVAEAFQPLEAFRAARPREDPNAIWVQQAAAEAVRWRKRNGDEAVPRLLKESIRFEPFVVRRSSAPAS